MDTELTLNNETIIENAKTAQQKRTKICFERPDINHVQSFINNISFPKSLDELYFFITEHGRFSVEDILYEDETVWTSPLWAKIGDIVFFMHTKTAISTITKLRTELYSKVDIYSENDYSLLLSWINRGIALHKKYGGKIFAIGVVSGAPEYIPNADDDYESSAFYHWKSRIYSAIDNVIKLKNPVDISEFNSFITVSRQGAITGIFGKEFDKLRETIAKTNDIPYFLRNCTATPLPLSKISKTNWLSLTKEYRRSFMLESQFRSFYTDYLLSELGDQKKIFKECRCNKNNIPDSFVDNVIYFHKKYLPVEIKLSVPSAQNISLQLSKYTNTNHIVLDNKTNRKITPEKIYNEFVLVIDTYNIYLYQEQTTQLLTICSLDDLNKTEDIIRLKETILTLIN